MARDGLMGLTTKQMAELAKAAAFDWRCEARRMNAVGDTSGRDWALQRAAECDARANKMGS